MASNALFVMGVHWINFIGFYNRLPKGGEKVSSIKGIQKRKNRLV